MNCNCECSHIIGDYYLTSSLVLLTSAMQRPILEIFWASNSDGPWNGCGVVGNNYLRGKNKPK
jgi:hypothetical protein